MKNTLIIGMLLVSFYTSATTKWKFEGASDPEKVGCKLTFNFLASPHMLYAKTIHYAEVCTWYGALKLAAISNNTPMQSLLEKRFEPLLSADSLLLPTLKYRENFNNYVDFSMFGCLPFELYNQTKKEEYLKLGLTYADEQWLLPDYATESHREYQAQGLTWQTRYWIDDMYMITIVQAKAYEATNNRKYIDRTANEMMAYLDTLQRDNGLFYHSPDAPFYWGRGNGWMAVGMTEVLRSLPPDHQQYKQILACYRKMMNSLKQCQNKEGLWGQLVDRDDIWTETSGSAMFLYAMICGINYGWLDADEYTDIVKKAWPALVSYIDKDGNLTEVCIGTGKRNDERFYYDRPRKSGDFHGQAPVLWCVYALLESK